MRVLTCYFIIALMMLATPQTTAEQQSSGKNVTWDTSFENEFGAEEPSWFDTVAYTMTTGLNLGLTAVANAHSLRKVGAVLLPMISGGAPDWKQASVPEMGGALLLGMRGVEVVWGPNKNTGKSEANKALIETFRGVWEETQALHAVEVKNLHSQLERSQQDVQNAQAKERGAALQAAADVEAARTNLNQAHSAAEKVAEKLQEANNLLDTCTKTTNELREKLASCPNQLNLAKLLQGLFSATFGLVAAMLMFAMNIVQFTINFRNLITPVVYALFCFFLPAWGAGGTLCGLCAMVFYAVTAKTKLEAATENKLTTKIDELAKINNELTEKHNQLKKEMAAEKAIRKKEKERYAAAKQGLKSS